MLSEQINRERERERGLSKILARGGDIQVGGKVDKKVVEVTRHGFIGGGGGWQAFMARTQASDRPALVDLTVYRVSHSFAKRIHAWIKKGAYASIFSFILHVHSKVNKQSLDISFKLPIDEYFGY